MTEKKLELGDGEPSPDWSCVECSLKFADEDSAQSHSVETGHAYQGAAQEVSPHRYISTACLHGQHEKCRRFCKYCKVPCACKNCAHVEEVSPVSNSERDSKWIDAIQEALGDMGRIGDRHYFTFCLFLVMREAAKADLIDQDPHVEEMLEKLRTKIAESQKKLCEGDTRELKAALRTAVKIAKMYHGKIPVLSLSEKSYDAFAEAGKELAKVERLLG